MSIPRSCGDCSQAIPSGSNVTEVVCPINDKYYDRDKEGCFDPQTAKKLWAESVERILWLSSWLSPEAIKERWLPEVSQVPHRVFTIVR